MKRRSLPPVPSTPWITENKGVHYYGKAQVSKRCVQRIRCKLFSRLDFCLVGSLRLRCRRGKKTMLYGSYKFSCRSPNQGIFTMEISIFCVYEKCMKLLGRFISGTIRKSKNWKNFYNGIIFEKLLLSVTPLFFKYFFFLFLNVHKKQYQMHSL